MSKHHNKTVEQLQELSLYTAYVKRVYFQYPSENGHKYALGIIIIIIIIKFTS